MNDFSEILANSIKYCQSNPKECFDIVEEGVNITCQAAAKINDAIQKFKVTSNFKFTNDNGVNSNITIESPTISDGVIKAALVGFIAGSAAVLVISPLILTVAPAAGMYGLWGWLGYTTTTATLNTAGIVAGSSIGGLLGGAAGFVYSDDNSSFCSIRDTSYFVEENKFSLECSLQGNNKIVFDVTFDS